MVSTNAQLNKICQDVLDVETNVVTGDTLLELLVVHLDRLDLSRDVRGRDRDDHASLDDTSLHTTDGHRTDTTDLVNILEWETERLVLRTNRGLDGVDGIEKGLTLNNTALRLFGPALPPWGASFHDQ